MPLPALPPKGSTDWYAHYSALDAGVRHRAAVEYNVKEYGAVGNGSTDDTAAIQSAITACPAGCIVTFPPGTYVINSTLTITKAMTLSGIGAGIKTGTTPDASLQGSGRHINITAADVTICDLEFGPSITALPVSYGMSTINVEEAARAVITRCKINGSNIGGIRISGAGAVDCEVSYNRVSGTGITYSNAGASRTRCIGNTIDGAPENALSGTGNGSSPNVGCLVLDNVITNYGRMAIEDWNNCEETRIIGNRISGANQTSQGIAISAVGWRSIVEHNVITDFQTDAIEAKGAGAIIRGNIITQKSTAQQKTGTAIIVNGSSAGYALGANVTDNVIDTCGTGVQLWSACGPVTVTNNTFRNNVTAVSADSSASGTVVQASGNLLYYSDTHTASRRAGFDLYSTTSDGLRGSSITANRFFYDTTAGTSPNGEWSVKIVANGILVTDNTIDGGGVAAPMLGSPGATNSGIVVTNNRFMRGATYDLSGYTSPVNTGNLIS